MVTAGVVKPSPCCGRNASPLSAQQLTSSSAAGNCDHFHRRRLQQRAPQHSLQVRSALSRPQKEATVAKLKDCLDSSAAVFGVRYNKVSVKELEAFRVSLPAQAKIIVCKNSLMGVAVDQAANQQWAGLKDAFALENAWVFVHEDVLADTVKAYQAFDKKLKEKLPAEQRAKATPTNISGGVFDGRTLDKEGVLRLEKMPTKLEAIATIARLIKQVPTKLAVGIKQVPTKVAYGVQALADGDDKQAVVGDTFPKAAE